MDKAFMAMKALIAADATQRYPNHNKSFVIKTDTSNYQMGAVVLQVETINQSHTGPAN